MKQFIAEPKKCKSCGKKLGCLGCGGELKQHEKPEGFCDFCLRPVA